MHRRDFIRGALTAAPAVLIATACGGGGGGGPDAGASSFSVSSTGGDHVHRLTIECADLTGGGVTYTTTAENGHTHELALTADQLATIAAGNAVQVSVTTPHDHTWTVRRPAGAC